MFNEILAVFLIFCVVYTAFNVVKKLLSMVFDYVDISSAEKKMNGGDVKAVMITKRNGTVILITTKENTKEINSLNNKVK